ncbi:PilZ domain-containing protein [Neptuniibacter sp.]|uniref:PilZ domain-containing protein n=1 Tax=Neptuniibacter sp. TaxID=1962643 RepID=UPI003B58E25F
MTTPETERRRFTRINFDAATEVKQGDDSWQTTLVDISFNGMLLTTETAIDLEIGASVDLTVHLLGDDVTINTPAVLAHKDDDQYGFSIENLDLDSLTQIRRLVELNLGDEALLERELDHLFIED